MPKREIEPGYFVQQDDRGDLLFLDLASKRTVYIASGDVEEKTKNGRMKHLTPLYRKLDLPPLIQVATPETWLNCGGCGENYNSQNPCACEAPRPIAVVSNQAKLT